MPVQLTKRLVASLAPRSRPYEVRDLHVRGLLLRIQPSGHKAWIVTWAHGKRRTLGSASILTLDSARAHASQALAEALQKGLPSIAKIEPTSCTLDDFLTSHYSPWAASNLRRGDEYVKRIRGRFPSLLSRTLTEIDERAVMRWWQARTTGDTPASRATAARDLASLSSALSKAAEWKVIDTQPLAGFRQRETEPRTIVRYLSAIEEARLRDVLAARDARMVSARDSANAWRSERRMPIKPSKQGLRFADHLTPVVCLALNTGLRRGELLSLTWQDVDLDARMLTVRAANAKSGKQRYVPLNREAYSVMTDWAAQCVAGSTVFSVASVKNAWGKVVTQAALKNFRFHDLRHHFASRLVAKGVDLNTVRELLGHADLKMTLRYAHLAPENLAAAVAKL